MESKTVAIIGALDAELDLLMREMKELQTKGSGPFCFRFGTLAGVDVVLTKSGVGKVLAAMTAQRIIDEVRPSHIIFTGIAGALHSDLDRGDLVVGRDYIQHDLDTEALGFQRGEIPYTGLRIIPGSSELIELAASFHPQKHKLRVGRILSGDQFVLQSGSESHSYLTEELQGTAIEMEGAAVALVCHLQSIPFVAIRTISDRADASAALDFEAFLPVASHQSLAVVSHILQKLRQQ